MKKQNYIPILILLVVFILSCIWYCSDKPNKLSGGFFISDSTFIKKYTLPDIKQYKSVVPDKVITYKDTDVQLRKDIISKPIIVNTEVKPSEIKVTVIDSLNKIQTRVFTGLDLDLGNDVKSIIILSDGSLKIKKRTKVGKFLYGTKQWIKRNSTVIVVTGVVVIAGVVALLK